MKAKVCVHLDSAEESLVAGGARREHCGLDPASLQALGGRLGRQVLIRRSSRRLALYTVTAEDGAAGAPPLPRNRVGGAGRLGTPIGTTV